MAISSSPSSSTISISLCLFILFHGCVAQLGFGGQSPFQSSRGFGSGQRACRFERLDALEPSRRVQSEAGFLEYYEASNKQLQCAGLSVLRGTINPRGLMLPAYANAPTLVYITQGRGLIGVIYQGCPETYQSFQQQFEQSSQEGESETQRLRDEHQKVHRIRQGDIIAVPAGVTRWIYNDGDVPLVAVVVMDVNNVANQLDPRHREFSLAGRRQSILNGFDTQLLAEALGVNRELVQKLQSQTVQRGEIVHVQHGLRLLRASRSQELQWEQEFQGERYQEERTGLQGNYSNGLNENFCTMRIRENIDDPSRADYYNPRAGRITIVNSQKLPILNNVQMSASRIVLRRNAILAPYWTINAHTLMYVTGGRGRVQIVNDQGKTVFDGQLRSRQILLIPQNYAVLKRAFRQGLEWVSFKTNQNSMVNKIFGKASTLRSLPVDVLRVSYHLSSEQVWRLKNSRREEYGLFSPRLGRLSSEQEIEEYDTPYETRDADVSLEQVVN